VRRIGLLVLVAVAAGCGAQERAAPPTAATSNAHPVAGTFRPEGTKLASCHDQRCYEQAFGNVAYYRGPKAALALFDEKMRTDAAIASGCHRIAHAIGSASLARLPPGPRRAGPATTTASSSGRSSGRGPTASSSRSRSASAEGRSSRARCGSATSASTASGTG
jgi:hypothetical protein